MEKVVIFGAGQIAEVFWFYLTHDADVEVVGFTVDRAYLGETEFHGLPVVPFEEVTEHFRPADHRSVVAISFQGINRPREAKFQAFADLGYRPYTYVSSRATVWPGADIGAGSFIMEDNTIQPFTRVGRNVVMWSGNHLGHHSAIEDHCFIASHVVVSGAVTVGTRTFIGVNATIRDNIVVGSDNVIGMGAMVVRSTPPEAVVVGQPARLLEKKSSELGRI